jgi:hypothetical protein
LRSTTQRRGSSAQWASSNSINTGFCRASASSWSSRAARVRRRCCAALRASGKGPASRGTRAPRPKLLPSERDDFILRVAQKADGHIAPVADLLYAMLTVTDIEHLSSRSHRTVDEISNERRQARRRVLAAIADNV